MAVVYYQVGAAAVRDAVQCGLKLSEHADREVRFPGESVPRRAMQARLHPDDLPGRGEGFVCLRIEVDPARCHVGDADLYRLGRLHPDMMEQYLSSLVLLRDYRYGRFRSPECLIVSSVLDSQIAVTGHALDTPVLYESSAALYLQSRMASYEEACRDGGNGLFFAWCRLLESKGLMERFPDESGTLEAFRSKASGEILLLEVPDRKDAEVWP